MRVRLSGIIVSAVALTFAVVPRAGAQQTAMQPYTVTVEGTVVSFEMMPVAAGTVQLSAPEGTRTVEVGPFWIGKTEVPWELYDVYVYGLDRGADDAADAVSRPTKPYVLPGEAFGHEGMPALGMTFHAAQSFAHWLSAKTGQKFRVPTEAEWEHACRAGALGDAPLDVRAWHADNARDRTHRVGSSGADAIGVHDLLGNVAEWVHGFDADSVVKGGSFEDPPSAVDCGARRRQTSAWNATDPQLPKSRWWLPDAPFVGLRLIRDP